ncbi:iron-sulfur cluster assembly protein [Bauldia sp.]|uniref:iron-sulfur cluster assembly protein n=1 Tax=Bauldia sp. TaxID=2575872 RepID=UPI003BAC3711
MAEPIERETPSPQENQDASSTHDPRRAAVLERLDRVNDPELDESVVAMGFIGDLVVDGGDVRVDFRLPTYWCSANFAFLMAEDMRIAIETLPWVTRATVTLDDHFAARRINRGIAEKLPFEEVFADETAEGLHRVRVVFREKAFLGRQAALLDALLRRDSAARTLAVSMADLERLVHDDDEEIATAAARYLAARRHDGGRAEPDDPAFTTLEGTPVGEAMLADHRRATRRVLHAARANAEMCRIYLEERYSDAPRSQ